MNDSDQFQNVAALLKAIDDAYPFKTVHVPKHLLDEFNAGREEQTLQMHFTVAKEVEVTEDMIRMFLAQVDSIRANATPVSFDQVDGPPHTGREKTNLADQ